MRVGLPGLRSTADSNSGQNPGREPFLDPGRVDRRTGKQVGPATGGRHGERLRRDHHRRGSQRPHQRGVLRSRGRTDRGPGDPRQDRGAADTSAPFPDHPEINVTTYSYVMSLMPPTIIRELNLKQHGYDVTPFGPYFQAFPDGRAITVYADDAKKTYDSIAQFSKKDAETLAEVGGVAEGRRRRPGPAAAAGAAEGGLDGGRRPDRRARRRRGRCAARRPRRRRRHAPVHHERDAICSTTGSSPTRSRPC